MPAPEFPPDLSLEEEVLGKLWSKDRELPDLLWEC